MQNRARLLKQYQTHLKKQASYIVEGNAKSRRALRQHNREQIKQHPEWFPADAKPCAFIKTVPNPSEKAGQLYCGRQC
ncbi:hypothetical protein CQA88_31865 [Klebsiella pneumoniae]|nr:hypothetical protein CQA88_31865 [Klebsiella pneumoniae]